MSNVLIGIIGVILFIGLALAGALILGDDFRSVKWSTGGAGMLAQVDQVAKAASMKQLKTGSPASLGPVTPLIPRFLKTMPMNPASASEPFIVDLDGNSTGPAAFVMMSIAGSGDNYNYCLEIARQVDNMDTTNNAPPYPSSMREPVVGSTGCLIKNGNAPASNMQALVTGRAYVYSRI